jgi:hypothetical protein
VADVPTGVFATGSPRDTTAHRQEAAVEEDVGPDYSSTRPVSPYQARTPPPLLARVALGTCRGRLWGEQLVLT